MNEIEAAAVDDQPRIAVGRVRDLWDTPAGDRRAAGSRTELSNALEGTCDAASCKTFRAGAGGPTKEHRHASVPCGHRRSDVITNAALRPLGCFALRHTASRRRHCVAVGKGLERLSWTQAPP